MNISFYYLPLFYCAKVRKNWLNYVEGKLAKSEHYPKDESFKKRKKKEPKESLQKSQGGGNYDLRNKTRENILFPGWMDWVIPIVSPTVCEIFAWSVCAKAWLFITTVVAPYSKFLISPSLTSGLISVRGISGAGLREHVSSRLVGT